MNTLSELRDWYLPLAFNQQKSSHSRATLSNYFDRLLEIIGDKAISGLSLTVWDDYQKTMLSRKYAPGTANRHLATLKATLNLAFKAGKIKSNPMAHGKLLYEDNIRDRILVGGEYEKLQSNISGELKLIVALAFFTGMRKAEILDLVGVRLTWLRE